MMLSQSFVRSPSVIAVFAAVASAEETLPRPRSIILTVRTPLRPMRTANNNHSKA
jgi:hypothetical protein